MDPQTFQSIMGELESLEATDGLHMSGMLDISQELRQMLTWMIRQKRFQDEQVAEYLELDLPSIRKLLYVLLYKGFITEAAEEEPGQYRTKITVKPKFRVPKDILDMLDD
jgi:transcription initiation factor IIE alpha subunit